MLNNRLRFFIIPLCILIILCLLPQVSRAIPPPKYPSIEILVVNAPRDLSIQFQVNEKWINADVFKRAWETYFFCLGDTPIYANPNMNLSSIRVVYADKYFEISLPIDSWDGEFLYTLNLHTGSLIEGDYPGRTLLLICIRLIGLLSLKSVLFYILGFRTRKSWMSFLKPHLITQLLVASLFTLYNVGMAFLYMLTSFILFLLLIRQDIILSELSEKPMKYRIQFIIVSKIISVGLLIWTAQFLPTFYNNSPPF